VVVLRNNEESRAVEYAPPRLRKILVVIVLFLFLFRVSKGLVKVGGFVEEISSQTPLKGTKNGNFCFSTKKKDLACDLIHHILLLLLLS